MNIDLLIILVCVPCIAILGLLIFLRNTSQEANRRFGYFSIFTILWVVSNYISDNATTHSLFYTRLTIFFGITVIFSLLKFIQIQPNPKLFDEKNKIILIHTIYTYCLLPITFLPQFISSTSDKKFGSSVQTSVLYPLFLIYVLYSLILLIWFLIKQYRSTKLSYQKVQIRIITYGILIYAGLAIITNILIPLFLKNWSSSRYGPIFSLIFIGIMGYAILRHRLFDIKFVIVRSLGYTLSLITVGAISFVLLIGLGEALKRNNVTIGYQTFFFASITIIFAVTYSYFKKFFDQITQKLFYRDAYDTQSLLNDFNASIVSTLDLNNLIQSSTNVIDKYVKPLFCTVILESYNGEKVNKILEQHITNKNGLKDIKNKLEKIREKVILTDELNNLEDATLKLYFQENNIGLIARLSNTKKSTLGFIIMGYKKSGNKYNPTDKNSMIILIDELSIALQNSLNFEQIQQFNITLQGKVNEATKKLRKTNDKLREIDESKDEFISMASHQLRTPLTSVKGYISMVLEGDAGKISTKQKELLHQSFISSQRMVDLIADLLNVSRLKTGKFVIEAKPTNLATLIEGEIDQLTESAKSKNITLTYNKPKDFPVLMFDETKIRQVIMNFADNAIYYTPSGGKIQVNLENKPEVIEFSVTDNGIGVPRSEQHHLFTKFYRAGNARKARPDGTGLGLFMAKKVIMAEGGSLIFDSQEGKGSTFGFIFSKSKMTVSKS